MCGSCMYQDFERCRHCGQTHCREMTCKCRQNAQPRIVMIIQRIDVAIANFIICASQLLPLV